MYLCICNGITQKMLAQNSFLLPVIGSKCGKCLENQPLSDGERMQYLPDNMKKIHVDSQEYENISLKIL